MQQGFMPPTPPNTGSQLAGDEFDNAPASGDINRYKFPFGSHLVQIENITDKDGFYGYSFIMEFRALDGEAEGMVSSQVFQPLKSPQYKVKEFGKIKKALGACFGYSTDAECAQITSAVVAQCKQGALLGRLVRVESYPSPKPNPKTGEPHTLYRFSPYLENGQPVTRPLNSGVQASDVVAAPPPPAASAAPAFPPEGWQAHPTAPGYFWKGQECLSETDLRARVAA